MRKQKVGIFLFASILWCILSGIRPVPAVEDFFFAKKSQTLINGEAVGPPKVLKVWLKGDRIRYESEDERDKYFLILMNKGKTYELDKIRKTFKESSNETEKLKEISEHTMVISKRTGQKKKIEKWNCYEILLNTTIQGKKMKASCWLTEDIHISQEIIQKIAKFSRVKLMEELAKFPGYPVKVTMDSVLQGKRVKIISTLTEISKKSLKADFFKIPFEYTKVKP